MRQMESSRRLLLRRELRRRLLRICGQLLHRVWLLHRM